MSTSIHVTVTPNPPNGKEVRCNIVGPKRYVEDDTIWLEAGQDYDITFTLAGAHGIHGWHTTPFGNQAGIGCPQPGQGPNGSFGKGSGGNATSMTMTVTQPSRSLNSYRLDFNDGYFCDPIIVVG